MLLGPSARTVRGQLVELALSFHHVGPRNQTQFVRPGGGCFCPLNHLTNLKFLLYSSKKQILGHWGAVSAVKRMVLYPNTYRKWLRTACNLHSGESNTFFCPPPPPWALNTHTKLKKYLLKTFCIGKISLQKLFVVFNIPCPYSNRKEAS